jgi:peptide chain release factor 1
MFDKLAATEAKYDQLMAEMASPSVLNDNATFRSHSKALAEIQPLVEAFRSYKDVISQITAAEDLLKDPDMRELAQEELAALTAERDRLLGEIKVLLVPKDPNDEKNVVLEIRAGTGGDEAALFAGDLFRMYSRYAERQGWKVDVLNLSDSVGGGIKEVVALIEGRNVYSRMKYESGVHRVQRVPATEASGRIHTSIRRTCASIRSARADPAGRASIRPIPPSASPTFRPAWWSRNRTRNRRSRTARRP